MSQGATPDKARVLLVEDDEVVREHLAEQLADEYAVETAGEGEQALKAILRQRPDLIVTDLVMPGIGGVELVKTLRGTPSTATIPILMISGRAADEVRLEGFEFGADSFLAKPYTVRELRVRIRSMLQSSRMRRAAAQHEARQQAEHQALLERAALLESISDAFYAVDRQWRVTYANRRALDYFNLPSEAFVGKVVWDVLPTGRGTRIEQEYQRAMRTRQPIAFEIVSPATRRWVDINVYPTPQGLAINFRDITDRKRAEVALKDSELRFRSMADAAPVLMWRGELENRRTWFNKPWLDFTGRTLEQDLGWGWAQIVHPDDRERAIASCRSCLQQLAPLEVEFRLRRNDGEYRWMLDRGMPVFDGPGGAFSGYIGTCIDITDRKLAENELSRRAEEFHALADNISQLCWMAFADGHIYWYNRRWYEYTGTTPETQVGWGWESVIDPELLSKVKERWLYSLRIGEPFEMTFPIKSADGQFADFLTRVVPIRDERGTIVRWFGTNTDVSAQLATERQLRELTGTLEQRIGSAIRERQSAMEQLAHMQKMESIGQLTGGVAHDFNNLLTPIVGALDMLRKKLQDVRSQQLTAGALQAAERARVLIQRLLAFARKQHLETRAVDVRKVLEGMSDLLARSLGPQIEISIQAQQSLPPARIDPNQLELAILNLCLNARDAMPAGGSLAIEAAPRPVEQHPRLAPGAYICITVADTGCGMDEPTLRRAVEPFFTTKPAGHGTGLGLSMVHGLAAQSHGDLSLESSVGGGTKAILWLPATDEPIAESLAEETEHDERRDEEVSIVLVDDEDLVRTSTALMLVDAGYRVAEAASAAQALELIEKGLKVNLVVTDYAMPGMTGVQLAAALRQRDPHLPVLMITGFADLNDQDAGGLPRLAKPFRQAELQERISQLLESDGGGRLAVGG